MNESLNIYEDNKLGILAANGEIEMVTNAVHKMKKFTVRFVAAHKVKEKVRKKETAKSITINK